MEPDPFSAANIILAIDIVFYPVNLNIILGLLLFVLLLISSALISGSEVAFFSLQPTHIKHFKEISKNKKHPVVKLIEKPEQLLATILISNNFINIGIVILSSMFVIYDSSSVKSPLAFIDFSKSPVWGMIFQAGIVTFILVLFGEIIPKIYASNFAKSFAAFMAYPLVVLNNFFKPFSYILIKSTSIINKKIKKYDDLSIDDLSKVIDITSDAIKEEREILEGIVNFGNKTVTDIMVPRVDVVAIDIDTSFKELIEIINESEYSRMPVYKETFDNIQGIFYIKDLIKYLDEENFEWQRLIREAYFVPETKKINDLLEEFQTRKIHLAIVSDEYGGISGIVTLEDVLEEIVGDIRDEFDNDDEVIFKKIDNKNYIFDGKTFLNDFYKITGLPEDYFDDIKGEAETLAGLILEIKGEFPKEKEKITTKNVTFDIESLDNRRIKEIKITIN